MISSIFPDGCQQVELIPIIAILGLDFANVLNALSLKCHIAPVTRSLSVNSTNSGDGRLSRLPNSDKRLFPNHFRLFSLWLRFRRLV